MILHVFTFSAGKHLRRQPQTLNVNGPLFLAFAISVISDRQLRVPSVKFDTL